MESKVHLVTKSQGIFVAKSSCVLVSRKVLRGGGECSSFSQISLPLKSTLFSIFWAIVVGWKRHHLLATPASSSRNRSWSSLRSGIHCCCSTWWSYRGEVRLVRRLAHETQLSRKKNEICGTCLNSSHKAFTFRIGNLGLLAVPQIWLLCNRRLCQLKMTLKSLNASILSGGTKKPDYSNFGVNDLYHVFFALYEVLQFLDEDLAWLLNWFRCSLIIDNFQFRSWQSGTNFVGFMVKRVFSVGCWSSSNN